MTESGELNEFLQSTMTRTSADALRDIPEAPTFYPSAEQWATPYNFIESIRHEGEQFGIIKIVPPDGWRVPFAINRRRFRFHVRQQQVGLLGARERARRYFYDRLRKFNARNSLPLREPLLAIGEKRWQVDLRDLFVGVARRLGGYANLDAQQWQNVLHTLMPKSLLDTLDEEQRATASQALRSHYRTTLLEFERHWRTSTAHGNDNAAETADCDAGVHNNHNESGRAMHTTESADDDDDDEEPPPRRRNGGDAERNVGDVKADDGASGADGPITGGEEAKQANGTTKIRTRADADASASSTDDEELRLVSAVRQPPPPPSSVSSVMCEECERFTDAELMLRCDDCLRPVHTFCVTPPLNAPPSPNCAWYCRWCQSKQSREFMFINSPEVHSLGTYQRMADKFKLDHFVKRGLVTRKGHNGGLRNITDQMVEEEFWRIVESGEALQVEYGADLHSFTHGSGFPTLKRLDEHLERIAKQEATLAARRRDVTRQLEELTPPEEYEKYARDEWNLNNLPVVSESAFALIESGISGMMVPWVYVGMVFSAFCWHNEDHWAPSINYLHEGSTKVWYGIPGLCARQFERVMRDLAPELFDEQSDLLFQLVTTLSPTVLAARGVPVCRAHQHAGEFIVTFPAAYHAGFNAGFNVAEAVNFAPADWFPYGFACEQRYREHAKTPVFSLTRLLCGLVTNAPPTFEERDTQKIVTDNAELHAKTPAMTAKHKETLLALSAAANHDGDANGDAAASGADADDIDYCDERLERPSCMQLNAKIAMWLHPVLRSMIDTERAALRRAPNVFAHTVTRPRWHVRRHELMCTHCQTELFLVAVVCRRCCGTEKALRIVSDEYMEKEARRRRAAAEAAAANAHNGNGGEAAAVDEGDEDEEELGPNSNTPTPIMSPACKMSAAVAERTASAGDAKSGVQSAHTDSALPAPVVTSKMMSGNVISNGASDGRQLLRAMCAQHCHLLCDCDAEHKFALLAYSEAQLDAILARAHTVAEWPRLCAQEVDRCLTDCVSSIGCTPRRLSQALQRAKRALSVIEPLHVNVDVSPSIEKVKADAAVRMDVLRDAGSDVVTLLSDAVRRGDDMLKRLRSWHRRCARFFTLDERTPASGGATKRQRAARPDDNVSACEPSETVTLRRDQRVGVLLCDVVRADAVDLEFGMKDEEVLVDVKTIGAATTANGDAEQEDDTYCTVTALEDAARSGRVRSADVRVLPSMKRRQRRTVCVSTLRALLHEASQIGLNGTDELEQLKRLLARAERVEASLSEALVRWRAVRPAVASFYCHIGRAEAPADLVGSVEAMESAMEAAAALGMVGVTEAGACVQACDAVMVALRHHRWAQTTRDELGLDAIVVGQHESYAWVDLSVLSEAVRTFETLPCPKGDDAACTAPLYEMCRKRLKAAASLEKRLEAAAAATDNSLEWRELRALVADFNLCDANEEEARLQMCVCVRFDTGLRLEALYNKARARMKLLDEIGITEADETGAGDEVGAAVTPTKLKQVLSVESVLEAIADLRRVAPSVRLESDARVARLHKLCLDARRCAVEYLYPLFFDDAPARYSAIREQRIHAMETALEESALVIGKPHVDPSLLSGATCAYKKKEEEDAKTTPATATATSLSPAIASGASGGGCQTTTTTTTATATATTPSTATAATEGAVAEAGSTEVRRKKRGRKRKGGAGSEAVESSAAMVAVAPPIDEEVAAELACLCAGTMLSGGAMICCDLCDKWYHTACVSYTKPAADEDENGNECDARGVTDNVSDLSALSVAESAGGTPHRFLCPLCVTTRRPTLETLHEALRAMRESAAELGLSTRLDARVDALIAAVEQWRESAHVALSAAERANEATMDADELTAVWRAGALFEVRCAEQIAVARAADEARAKVWISDIDRVCADVEALCGARLVLLGGDGDESRYGVERVPAPNADGERSADVIDLDSIVEMLAVSRSLPGTLAARQQALQRLRFCVGVWRWRDGRRALEEVPPTADDALKAETVFEEQEERADAGDREILYCACRQPWSGNSVMLQCDLCPSWFHQSCTGISEGFLDVQTYWVCPECRRGFAHNLRGPSAWREPTDASADDWRVLALKSYRGLAKKRMRANVESYSRRRQSEKAGAPRRKRPRIGGRRRRALVAAGEIAPDEEPVVRNGAARNGGDDDDDNDNEDDDDDDEAAFDELDEGDDDWQDDEDGDAKMAVDAASAVPAASQDGGASLVANAVDERGTDADKNDKQTNAEQSNGVDSMANSESNGEVRDAAVGDDGGLDADGDKSEGATALSDDHSALSNTIEPASDADGVRLLLPLESGANTGTGTNTTTMIDLVSASE